VTRSSPVSREKAGHVYVLTSPNCAFIKIGGTDYAPMKRIKEINACEPYRCHGPWTLHDFREVSNWRAVERHLHYAFRDRLDASIKRQKELFSVSPVLASAELLRIDETSVLRKPKVDRMFQDQELLSYLNKLFRHTGLMGWLDLQGAWTFSLFPSTSGSRFFTLNIGRHEVAFSTMRPHRASAQHMIHMDRLIHDFREVRAWVKDRGGDMVNDNYASALERSTSVFFDGSFAEAYAFLDMPGVRRAMIAYWTEALIGLRERGSLSVHARRHNWNAVAALKAVIEGRPS
jgi:hypothetical protein